VPTSPGDSEAALRIFIRSVYEVDLGNDTPAWLDAITAPGQAPVDAAIEILTKTMVETETALETKVSEREILRSCLAVLYQSGPALEIAVKNMLTEMGAQITEPIKSGNEDGWITADLDGEILEGVLEIKSVRKASFDIDGLRQVNDWVVSALMETAKRYKGIFIGNHLINKEPSQRSNPFSSQWESRCQMLQIAALSTTTLFKAYRLIKDGQLDPGEFWRRLFQTNGIFKLSDISN
jgi:hypothetical protein